MASIFLMGKCPFITRIIILNTLLIPIFFIFLCCIFIHSIGSIGEFFIYSRISNGITTYIKNIIISMR